MPAHVLIADDDPSILLSLEFLMKKQGYQVLIARDGTEAYDLLQQHRPDVLLLDIMMPGMNGYELCTYVRQTPGFERVKVVFLSAKSKEVDIQQGYKAGADLYLPKPFSTRELAAKVRELIQLNPTAGNA
ncbi:response regulator transcription factor [Spirosoma rhododendri]|uniref:Response regulator n=1 Tax=Spirosoma rhododendri TaxID=2728024 RepID=A0A7L5DPW2_9BACT|nr:response regulator [Spirosoma rhododendri]QJD79622.1 response regulator [Spirosoma rhododendri]